MVLFELSPFCSMLLSLSHLHIPLIQYHHQQKNKPEDKIHIKKCRQFSRTPRTPWSTLGYCEILNTADDETDSESKKELQLQQIFLETAGIYSSSAYFLLQLSSSC